MENMDRTPARVEPPVPFEWDLERRRDQIVVLQNISWDQYVALNDARDGRQPQFAYLDGELELVTVSRRYARRPSAPAASPTSGTASARRSRRPISRSRSSTPVVGSTS